MWKEHSTKADEVRNFTLFKYKEICSNASYGTNPTGHE
ncbi:hypothetical protein OESDEN_06047 [Oesophagostomum dentatum]|uniref:Uncharacterized protein n=1 Tax=Oesophagostomum dentatum TaxID=61180 RepID=A0A0B1TD24_OESDE|nr:hypothetical protein OESDEN_06047 [Oesophagostomum dentatum]